MESTKDNIKNLFIILAYNINLRNLRAKEEERKKSSSSEVQ